MYRRYVDDTFLVFENASQVEPFLNYLNNQHPNIIFTCEIENNGKLSFLDIQITRNDNEFQTSVYRKKTFTGLGMRFDSFIPSYLKKNIISCLVIRAFRLCSHSFHFDDELLFLKNYFCDNLFPLKFIKDIFRSTLYEIYNSKPVIMTAPRKPLYFKLPYLGPQSFKIRKEVEKIVKKFYPHCKIKCIFSEGYSIGRFFRFKDILPLHLVSSVVYKYQCGQCSASYIGETRKQMRVRISQHQGRSYRTGSRLNCQEPSKILEHRLNSGHSVDETDFKILSHCNAFDLKCLESIFIHEQRPSLNDQSSSFELNILK